MITDDTERGPGQRPGLQPGPPERPVVTLADGGNAAHIPASTPAMGREALSTSFCMRSLRRGKPMRYRQPRRRTGLAGSRRAEVTPVMSCSQVSCRSVYPNLVHVQCHIVYIHIRVERLTI